MPSLDEIRKWARGVFVTGLPRPKGAPVEEEPAPPAGKRTHAYKINADGSDALLKFGKHRGRTVTHLAKSNPDYLMWMIRCGSDGAQARFDEDLLDVVRFQMERDDGD